MSNSAVDRHSGQARSARQVPSPNSDERPPGVLPELIIVHGISLPPGVFGGAWIERLFTNTLPVEVHPYFKEIEGLKVSSHMLIRRDGEPVQFVSFNRRAWHAGVSNYRGRECCNDFSIGIELEGADDVPYEPAQYRSLAESIVQVCAVYPTLSIDRVVGHSEVAPGRKTDPGAAFDWRRLKAFIAVVQGTRR